MKHCLFFYTVSVLFLFSCNTNQQKAQENMPAFGNWLAVEGGGKEVILDTITPLPNLIKRLNDNWEFIMTGKAYWIGYTNDMFSIAAHRNEAIPLLVNFFKTTDSQHGKIGALYTLHLIGINGHIEGRVYEKFINVQARNALLKLLNNKEYAFTIMKLLNRDPWQSDIPILFEILRTNTDNEIVWAIINSLNRYKIVNLPINNVVSDTINKLFINLTVKNSEILEPDFDFESQIKDALRKFEKKYPTAIKVEKELYNQTISKYYLTKLPSNLTIKGFLQRLGIEQDDDFRYGEIGCKIQYQENNNVLCFITIETARVMVNDWWIKLPETEKKAFVNNYSVETERRKL